MEEAMKELAAAMRDLAAAYRGEFSSDKLSTVVGMSQEHAKPYQKPSPATEPASGAPTERTAGASDAQKPKEKPSEQPVDLSKVLPDGYGSGKPGEKSLSRMFLDALKTEVKGTRISQEELLAKLKPAGVEKSLRDVKEKPEAWPEVYAILNGILGG